MTRKKLILSLFDHKSAEINLSELDTFILQATDSIHPEFLKYRDIDWYAELRCKVFHKGKLKKLTLILKVEKSDQNAFRWSVVSAKADFLNYNYSKADSIYFKQLNEKFNKDSYFNPLYFLSPVCHGLDFMNIDNVFINKGHVNDYIYKGPYSIELSRLILQIQKSEIKFVQVNSVRYHLLQINGWILTVDNFERNEKNSGWLISRLFKASSSQKSDYLITKLNIPKS
ncbi:MAG TPA: hypothetical protein VJY62_16905 [Bacteroidia bacterium]|nr:hypothetical protein [Bacteroidia bacterium]